MRLFVAVNPPPATAERLLEVQAELRRLSLQGNFSLRDNLHLTLAFLGELDAPDAAIDAMNALEFTAFELFVDRIGRGHHHGRDLWWACVAESRPLKDLQRELVAELAAHRCPFDDRPYRPHITLARQVVCNYGAWPIEPFAWPVSQVDLMWSQRVDGELTYTPIFSREALSWGG